MGEEIELLENHPRLHADRLNIANITGQRDAINNNFAALVFFQAVDRADKGGFARPGWANDHHHFFGLDRQIKIAQSMKLAIPLIYILTDNNIRTFRLSGHKYSILVGS